MKEEDEQWDYDVIAEKYPQYKIEYLKLRKLQLEGIVTINDLYSFAEKWNDVYKLYFPTNDLYKWFRIEEKKNISDNGQ